MKGFDYMPGVPAGGHITRGYWHPGRASNCHKRDCLDDHELRALEIWIDTKLRGSPDREQRAAIGAEACLALKQRGRGKRFSRDRLLRLLERIYVDCMGMEPTNARSLAAREAQGFN